jgi:NAD dependent epimerase/dehydratase family enzyme
MKFLIAVTGGAMGSAVASNLSGAGYELILLVRRVAGKEDLSWDSESKWIDEARLEGFDGSVQVASMPRKGRWLPEFKQRIRDIHVGTIRLLAEALTGCQQKRVDFDLGLHYFELSV